MAAPAVDAVIPTRDTRELVLACLDSLVAAGDGDMEIHVVVVDNASRDGTAEALAARHPPRPRTAQRA